MDWLEHITKNPAGENNGIAFPCPAIGSGGLTISTLVDSGNNANGKFFGTVIGEDKLRYELSFASLTPTQFRQFLNLFDRSRGGHFVQEFRVFDPRVFDPAITADPNNGFVTMEMYVSDRSGRPLRLDGDFRPTQWMDVKASLTQV